MTRTYSVVPLGVKTLAPLETSGGKTLLQTDGSGSRHFQLSGEHGFVAWFECIGGGTARLTAGGASWLESCSGQPSESAGRKPVYKIAVTIQAHAAQRWRLVVREGAQ